MTEVEPIGDEESQARDGRRVHGFAPEPSTIAAARQGRALPEWLSELRGIVGPQHVLHETADLWVYSHDRSPYAVFNVRNSRVPATLPSAIACPGACLNSAMSRGSAVDWASPSSRSAPARA